MSHPQNDSGHPVANSNNHIHVHDDVNHVASDIEKHDGPVVDPIDKIELEMKREQLENIRESKRVVVERIESEIKNIEQAMKTVKRKRIDIDDTTSTIIIDELDNGLKKRQRHCIIVEEQIGKIELSLKILECDRLIEDIKMNTDAMIRLLEKYKRTIKQKINGAMQGYGK